MRPLARGQELDFRGQPVDRQQATLGDQLPGGRAGRARLQPNLQLGPGCGERCKVDQRQALLRTGCQRRLACMVLEES